MESNKEHIMTHSMRQWLSILVLISFWFLSGCKKLVEVPAPVTSLSSANVYSTDATAIAALTGIYSSISNTGTYGAQLPGMSGLAGLSADELTLYSGANNPGLNLYYENALTNNNPGLDFWPNIYSIIYMANAAITGLTGNVSLTPAVQQQLLGEADFDRAFCYFYLVNLYGDVPLVLTTNYTTNATLARTPAAQVWQQIILDLHEAQMLLSPNFLDQTLLNHTQERLRPTKWAATALLARVYLYNANWTGADSAASAVISNSLFQLNGLGSVFLTTSTEAIWQLQPVTNNGFDTQDAMAFIIPSTGPNSNNTVAYLNDSMINTFEPNDQRRTQWVDSVIVGGITYYYPYKYKSDSFGAPITEYEMVLRLGEQYLIQAEAEAYNPIGTGAAIADLNIIRSRAGLPNYAGATDQTSVLNAIYHERRVELFTEWGHRWFDLKRTNTINTVMGTDGACVAKGGSWNSNWQWYPIPLTELQADPNLVQNNGY
jgi:hypothetical protein